MGTAPQPVRTLVVINQALILMPSSRSKNKQPQPRAPEPQHPQRKRRVRNTATASDVEPRATTVTEPSAERLSSPLQPSDEELSAFISQLKQSQRSTGAPTMQPPDETNGQPPQHAGAAASNQPIPVPQQTKPAARQAHKSKARTSPPEQPPTPPAPPEAEQSPPQQPTPPNSVAHQQQHHAHSQSESGNSSKRRRKHRRKKSAPTPAATPAGQENKHKPQTNHMRKETVYLSQPQHRLSRRNPLNKNQNVRTARSSCATLSRCQRYRTNAFQRSSMLSTCSLVSSTSSRALQS